MKDIVKPLLDNKTAVGVMLGDEICCSNLACWSGQLDPVTKRLRSLLGPDAIIYTNECAHPGIPMIPDAFDIISVDVYDGYSPGSNASAEVARAKEFYSTELFPKLASHQATFLVPGTFACSNTSYMPLADSSKNVVTKLEGYFEWAKSESRIIGFNPWHFNNRSNPQHSPPCKSVDVCSLRGRAAGLHG